MVLSAGVFNGCGTGYKSRPRPAHTHLPARIVFPPIYGNMLVRGVQLVIIATLLLYSTCETSPHTGGYNTADGSQCTWFDLRKSHTEVALATACVCKDANGRSQSYGCQYSAELYKCDEFVDNSKAVLSDLVSTLSG